MTYPDATAALPQSYNLCPPAVGDNGPNYITGVRDQGECNSCTAFAVVAAIEGAISIKHNVNNPTLHLSEDQLFECAGPGCDTNAWYPDQALLHCQSTGITDFAHYPRGSGGCATPLPGAPNTKITGFTPLHNATEIKNCLTGTGMQASPVVTLLLYYKSLRDWAPNNFNKIYKFQENDPNDVRIGGHAVCIVGYDDQHRCWICKNSFGPQWGGVFNGFFKIAYGDCYIDSYRMYGVAVA
jgi:C1A family cysteine protease